MSSKNQSPRKLAAILFADIVGYTSLMQKDESEALTKIKRYQEVLNNAANDFHGQVLKNYGDGSLMTFSNSADAVKAAIQIQQEVKTEPTVPLRIGIHIGEFIVEKGDIYGNGVNLASRIESLGIEGTILFSKNVYQKIKNQPEFKAQSIGSFEFKNVEEPMEVFALANDGFPIPERNEIQGKLKIEPKGKFLSRWWQNKVPHYLLGYLILSWGLVNISTWGLNQVGVSPHWSRMLLIILIGLIPSIIIYLNKRNRISSDRLTRGEKIIIPTNLLVLGTVLFFLFRSADLGAVTHNITFLNADGIEETHNVVKKEFQQFIPVFRFDQINQDSINAWFSPGITVALAFDLDQDKYLFVSDREDREQTTSEKIEEAKVENGDYYIDGTYQVVDRQFEITPHLRNSKNGNLISSREFKGDHFFSLIDSISLFIKSAVGLSQAQIEESIDLRIEECLTDNLEAFRFLTLAKIDDRFLHLEKAIELDTTLAIASLDLAIRGHFMTRGILENSIHANRAMRHRKKLPFRDQIAVLTTNHVVKEEWTKAEQLLKMQLETDPNNGDFNFWLLATYFISGQTDKVIEHAENRFAQDPNFLNGINAMKAAFMKGEPKTVVNQIKPFLLLDGQNTFLLSVLATAYIHDGQYELAKETIEKTILIDPDAEYTMSYLLESANYLIANPDALDDINKFEGTYRNSSSEQISDNRVIGNQLFGRASNQFGDFLYPAGDNVFVFANPDFAYRKEYLFNEQGDLYAAKNNNIFETIGNGFINWKQDSIIWNAEELLKNKEYELALEAYNLAIQNNPEHYYLYQARKHAAYASTKSTKELQELYQRHVGQYGEIELWIENEQLIIKQEGLARHILLPISDNEFVSLRTYEVIFAFESTNGIVDIYQEHLYNHDDKTFKIDPNWRREKEVLLN